MARKAVTRAWLNNAYQVNIDKAPRHGFPGTTLWHLSIKRLDKRAVHDWRDLQAIKNMLAGPQYEAVELYPSRSRTVDQANQYHLWVFVAQAGSDAPQLPFGWTDRSVLDVADRCDRSRQRGLHQSGATI